MRISLLEELCLLAVFQSRSFHWLHMIAYQVIILHSRGKNADASSLRGNARHPHNATFSENCEAFSHLCGADGRSYAVAVAVGFDF